MEEAIKKYLKENLSIYADYDDVDFGYRINERKMVITLMLGREKISETKIWVK